MSCATIALSAHDQRQRGGTYIAEKDRSTHETKNMDTPMAPSPANTPAAGNMIIPSACYEKGKEKVSNEVDVEGKRAKNPVAGEARVEATRGCAPSGRHPYGVSARAWT